MYMGTQLIFFLVNLSFSQKGPQPKTNKSRGKLFFLPYTTELSFKVAVPNSIPTLKTVLRILQHIFVKEKKTKKKLICPLKRKNKLI